MEDPGLALRTSTLESAWKVLQARRRAATGDGRPMGISAFWAQASAEDAVEDLAISAGLRSRRVILDGHWWKQAATPMLARIEDRRSVRRPDDPMQTVSLAIGTGWVVLMPLATGGLRMLAPDGKGGIAEWPLNEETAERLAPFAFSFHGRFPARALKARDILRFAFSEGGPDLGLLLMAGIVSALVGLLTPMATGWLIDKAIPGGSGAPILGVIAALGLAGIALIALDILRTYAVLRFEARIGVAMQAALVDRVVSAPVSFFRNFSSGDLALRMGSVNIVLRTITGSTIATFVTSLFLCANLGLMIAYSPALTLAASGIVLLVIAISTTLGLMRLKVGPRIEALDGRLSAQTFEIFAGISKLRASAAESRVFQRWYGKYHEFRDANGDSTRLSNYEMVAMSMLQPAATILVLALAWKLSSASAMTTGTFVAFHAALLSLLGGVHGLVSTALDVVNLRPVWDRARPILDTPPEDAVGGGERHEPQGAINLSGVSFAYPGGPTVLDKIDLTVNRGEFVAIVGASGSGKSTLLRLLLGFETPALGAVRYDGRDLATLDFKYLRSRLGTVLQGGRLWAGDLLTNIVGTSNAPPEAATQAAAQAGLLADIEAMPMGLYTVVGEGLSTLSGGQRQRVMIARALVGKPKVLLLDEATSALDNVSQAIVLASLARLEATRIVIAHRLNTVRDADRIVVLENGRIVQQGTFRELAEQRGPFSAMLARQVA
ncbi:MAG: ATP-binding cassette domain-containing protein [Usitatibacter sp.]